MANYFFLIYSQFKFMVNLWSINFLKIDFIFFRAVLDSQQNRAEGGILIYPLIPPHMATLTRVAHLL